MVQEKNQMVADTEQSAGSESESMLSETQSCASSCQAIAPKPHPPSRRHYPELPELTVTSISYEALWMAEANEAMLSYVFSFYINNL